jgi:N-acetylglucosamine-6-phosphate deacetylase
MMTLSPELEGGERLVEALCKQRTVAAVGHSAVHKRTLERARNFGLSHGTHIFNATKRPEPPFGGCISPDMNEFCLADKDMTVDVVVDGQCIHVDDTLLRLAWMCKGPEKLILISDSMSTAGLKPASYPSKHGRLLIVDSSDVCRFEDGVICGSTMTMLDALKNLMVRLNLPMEQALPAATSNPARLLGLGDRKGGIATGMDADIVVLDETMNVHMAMVGGTILEDE